MATPGITAPESSASVPFTVPLDCCADAQIKEAATTGKSRIMETFMVCLRRWEQNNSEELLLIFD